MSYTLAYTGAEIDALLGKIDAIFVAEYGSTIYSEVTAAIAAGNKVIVANAGKVYVYAGTDDNSGYVFTQSGPNVQSPSVTYATLSTGDVWSTATGALPSITYVDTAVAAEQARAEGVEAGKADKDGIYPDLTAGTALQLLGNTYTEDKTPYNFRKSGGSVKVGTREKDKLVGGTIAWNQLYDGSFSTNPYWSMSNASGSVSNNVYTVVVSANGAAYAEKSISAIASHVYIMTASVKSDSNKWRFYFFYNNFSVNMRFDVTTSWTQVSALFKEGNDPKNTFRVAATKSDNLPVAGDWCQIKECMMIDLTQMFGSTIADYIYSLEQATVGAGVAYFRKLFPKPYYDYNAGELMSVKTSAHNMTGKNLFNPTNRQYWISQNALSCGRSYAGSSDSGNIVYVKGATTVTVSTTATQTRYRVCLIDEPLAENASATPISGVNKDGTANSIIVNVSGHNYLLVNATDLSAIQVELGSTATAYEPYELHSYALDPDLELRGIPKLDANNALYYDGDIYESNKKVTRRYALSHLGDWAWNTNGTVFYAYPPSTLKLGSPSGAAANMLCAKYVNTDYVTGTSTDKTIYNASSTGMVYINDSAYSDAATFKAALNGVYLLYEVKAPTTEEADPYAEIQIVSPYGTEEYVDERAVAIPVGHDTEYPTDLVAKIEEIPDPPTADGTYTLKASVSSGSVTYSWEA